MLLNKWLYEPWQQGCQGSGPSYEAHITYQSQHSSPAEGIPYQQGVYTIILDDIENYVRHWVMGPYSKECHGDISEEPCGIAKRLS